MSIYSDSPNGVFKPTFLYIKQHKITGLKYFGKTTGKNPIKYLGSGTYWTRHLEKHGKLVDTIWYKLFTNKKELQEFALNFSIENNIVESNEWANLKPEDGLRGGGVKGIKITPHTEEHKKKISEGVQESNLKLGKVRKPKVLKGRSTGGWVWSEEDKKNHSLWQVGVPKRRMCCIHCKVEGGIANILQWHGDKCKMNPVKNSK
jgi:hypothetical protein